GIGRQEPPSAALSAFQSRPLGTGALREPASSIHPPQRSHSGNVGPDLVVSMGRTLPASTATPCWPAFPAGGTNGSGSQTAPPTEPTQAIPFTGSWQLTHRRHSSGTQPGPPVLEVAGPRAHHRGLG